MANENVRFGDIQYWNSQPYWNPLAIPKLNRWYDFGEIEKYCVFVDNLRPYYETWWNNNNSYALRFAYDRITKEFPNAYSTAEKEERRFIANDYNLSVGGFGGAHPRIPKQTVITGADGVQRYALYSQKTNSSTGPSSAASAYFKLDGFKVYSYVALFYNAQPYTIRNRDIVHRLFTGRFNAETFNSEYFVGPTLNPVHTPKQTKRSYAKGEACGTTDTFFINSLNYTEEQSVPAEDVLEKWCIIADTHFDLSWLSSSSEINHSYCDPFGRYGGNLYKSGFGEILWFEGELTTEERQKCEGYLAYKWNMQSILPTSHPYKTYPPPLYYVKGVVMDKTGTPTANRKVYLINQTNDEYYGSTITKADGSFSIQIPKGDKCLVLANLEPDREPLSYKDITPIAIPLENI